jgi:hypothetical protein
VGAVDERSKQTLVHDVMRIIVDEDAMLTFLYSGQNIAARSSRVHDDRFYARGQYNPSLADAWLAA